MHSRHLLLCEQAALLSALNLSLRDTLCELLADAEELRASARVTCVRSGEARARSQRLFRELGRAR